MDVEHGLFTELRRVYGSLTSRLIEKLKTPPRRLYVRVITSRITRSDVLKLLELEGVKAHADPYYEEAIYMEVEGPFNVECESEKYIVVDEKTAVSLLLGSDLYRPGVVESMSFRRGERLWATTRRGTRIACIEAVVSSSAMSALKHGLVGVNVASPYRAPRISSTRVYSDGLIYPQSLPSMATVIALSPKPGDLVVDMNAAPGGKTSHIVQVTRGLVRLVSIDRSERKAGLVRELLRRLQLDYNVVVVPGDSRYIHLDLNLEGRVDRVLIDPPCSNLGVRPILDYERSLKDVLNLAEYQKQFLKSAYFILKPGGVLVYSTCTLTMRENEENVRYAIEELGYSPVELPNPLPYSEVVKYKGVVGYRFSPFTEDMPGYFIAILTK
jgi:16S rRNA (cytosine967-C5)-methyltransferase